MARLQSSFVMLPLLRLLCCCWCCSLNICCYCSDTAAADAPVASAICYRLASEPVLVLFASLVAASRRGGKSLGKPAHCSSTRHPPRATPTADPLPPTRVTSFPPPPRHILFFEERCEELAAVLSEEGGKGSGCWVLADEIYERITYDTPHVAFATLPGMFERTMTVSRVILSVFSLVMPLLSLLVLQALLMLPGLTAVLSTIVFFSFSWNPCSRSVGSGCVSSRFCFAIVSGRSAFSPASLSPEAYVPSAYPPPRSVIHGAAASCR